jgi:hypothetical protein
MEIDVSHRSGPAFVVNQSSAKWIPAAVRDHRLGTPPARNRKAGFVT